MRHHQRHIAATLLLLLTACSRVGSTRADEPPSATTATGDDAQPGVLLLNDGGALEGQLTRDGDWYIVARAGSQIQVALNRVQFVGRSLHDAYVNRRDHLTQNTAELHLALAEWCLRYNLTQEARTELDVARSLDADP